MDGMPIGSDLAAYVERSQRGPCFICAHLAGADPADVHHEIYADEECVAFLNRYPTLLGYTLVVPRRHVTDVTGDRELYRQLTGVVHDVAEALKQVVPTERVYLLSLGSHQGNAHVHWHVAPLPPGVPYGRQQFHALMIEANGVLDLTDAEQAALARRLAGAVSRLAEDGEPGSGAGDASMVAVDQPRGDAAPD
jgi:diadenosine tetraphosphate (Ap4A) HIT family hydrolase